MDQLLTDLLELAPPRVMCSSLSNISSSVLYLLCKSYDTLLMPINAVWDADEALFDITAVLDICRENLNTGHWSDVHISEHHLFTLASYVKIVLMLKTKEICGSNRKITETEKLRETLKVADLGLLLGAPLSGKYENLLTEIATRITKHINRITSDDDGPSPPKKLLIFKDTKTRTDLTFAAVENVFCPSVESFRKNYFAPKKPVHISGCISHWPALEKWTDLSYFTRIAGDRSVPIELGSNYAEDSWSQKIMTVKEFISNHMVNKEKVNDVPVGYLAQHQLFTQIPELRKDIIEPDYCCIHESEQNSEQTDINAWFGPVGTVSPLHYDPKHNLLAQVVGVKQVILIAPSDSQYLYPYPGKMLNNTAQVDPIHLDLEKFPEFKKAVPLQCVLKPGDMLYIPPEWWHHVTAKTHSFSVSFWWK